MKTRKELKVSIAVITIVLLSLILVPSPPRITQFTAFQNGGTSQFVPMVNAASLSNAIISAVQSGTTSTSKITLGPSPNPIGTSINIDIRIDDVLTGFWGWFLPTVTWNPAVMNLTGVVKGPFLSDNTHGDSTSFLGDSKTDWANYDGTLSGGLSEAIFGVDTSTDASGVLATLTFLITGTGNSTIGIAGGNLRANEPDNTGVNVACNNATVLVTNNIPNTPTPNPTFTSEPVQTTNPTQTQNLQSSSSSPSQSATSYPSQSTTSSPSQSATSKPSTSSQSTSPTTTSTVSAPEFPTWIIAPIFITSLLASLAYVWRTKTAKLPSSA